MYRLPRNMRNELRRPLGRIFKNTAALLKYLRRVRFVKLVAVGDVCAKELIINGVMPDVAIIDKKTRRKKMPWNIEFPAKIIKVKNRPSTISGELVGVVSKSFGKRTLIDVKGEEDLAVLPAIKYCPFNSIVIYGLWFKGVVAVKASRYTKNRVNGLLGRMHYED